MLDKGNSGANIGGARHPEGYTDHTRNSESLNEACGRRALRDGAAVAFVIRKELKIIIYNVPQREALYGGTVLDTLDTLSPEIGHGFPGRCCPSRGT